eukprot:TRINITY_DN13450_c1_g1_i4.p2 TRINITY_DN13450_c1_g1~~TRINITY_DN13450_c1_g1_i4.p2  ORF type:complete len:152 (+),score=2.23 TRINITY_DN13450_c1_g1_i4:454-909(+)
MINLIVGALLAIIFLERGDEGGFFNTDFCLDVNLEQNQAFVLKPFECFKTLYIYIQCTQNFKLPISLSFKQILSWQQIKIIDPKIFLLEPFLGYDFRRYTQEFSFKHLKEEKMYLFKRTLLGDIKTVHQQNTVRIGIYICRQIRLALVCDK